MSFQTALKAAVDEKSSNGGGSMFHAVGPATGKL